MRKNILAKVFVALLFAMGRLAVAAEKQDAMAPVVCSVAEERAKLAELKAIELAKYKTQALDKSVDLDKRGLAILRIAELGSKDAAEFLGTVWETPLGVLDHERLCLIDWCGEHCGTNAVPMLTKALRQEWRDERWRAARELAWIQGDAALPTLRRLVKDDPDGIVRSQVQEYVKTLDEQSKAGIGEAERVTVIHAVITWGRMPDSGSYLKGTVIYLLRDKHALAVQNETVRLYSMAELKLLGKMLDSYSIQELIISGSQATALLKYAVDPPDDPVPFPFAGWRLTLTKAEGKWSVTGAVRQGM